MTSGQADPPSGRTGPSIVTRLLTRTDRAWFARLGLPVPLLMTRDGLPTRLVRLVPQQWTALHWLWARAHGWFWLRCRSCGQRYGGHQATGFAPDCGRQGVCPWCTRIATGAAARDFVLEVPRVPWGNRLILTLLVVFWTFELVGLLAFAVILGASLAPAHGLDYAHPVAYATGVLTSGAGVAVLTALLLTALPTPWASWRCPTGGKGVTNMSGAYGPERVPPDPPPAPEPAPTK